MNQVRSSGTVRLIGVPMDLGQTLRGVDVGPSALRYAGLAERLEHIGYEVEDQGNIDVVIRATVARGRDLVEPVRATCEVLYQVVQTAIEENCLPVIMGGDHSIAIGSVGGTTHRQPAGVLWIDAHADFNTPASSPSGSIHGMPLAVLCGKGPEALVNVGRPGPKIRPEDVVIIALRTADAGERQELLGSRVGVYTMREIDEKGIAAVTRAALQRLSGHQRIHVSFDVDSVDPMFAPGVGTPVPGGLNTREAHLLMELIAEDGRVASVGIVEINPDP